jgi:hypothetical protein
MMDIPTVTVTMLGPSGSGKSTFMLGMYATLAGGHRGYFAHAAHDDHLQLMDAWDLLYEDGQLPPPTPERTRNYEFHFLQGIDPLLRIQWMDYRGGALSDRAEAGDTAELIKRMTESDSVYLVLDGTTVAKWVRAKVDAEVAGRAQPEIGRLRRILKVEDMTSMLQSAITQRRELGKQAPSLVVVVTKMDTLTEISRLSEAETVGLIRDYLDDLLPVALVRGVSALVQTVQLGEFGTEKTAVVDANRVAPRDLEKPFIFTFLEYLTNRITEETRLLEVVTRRQAETDLELATLRNRLGSSLWRRGEIGGLTEAQRQLVAEAERTRQSLQDMESRAERLRRDLRDTWIIRDGSVPVQSRWP